jgi:hypothetical protein
MPMRPLPEAVARWEKAQEEGEDQLAVRVVVPVSLCATKDEPCRPSRRCTGLFLQRLRSSLRPKDSRGARDGGC